MSLLDNVIFTGCIDGMVFASNINKGIFFIIFRSNSWFYSKTLSHN